MHLSGIDPRKTPPPVVDHVSDFRPLSRGAASDFVMAEGSAQDVVNQTRPVDAPSSIDIPASTIPATPAGNGEHSVDLTALESGHASDAVRDPSLQLRPGADSTQPSQGQDYPASKQSHDTETTSLVDVEQNDQPGAQPLASKTVGHLLNGDGQYSSNTEDGGQFGAALSVSGGSDTDGTRSRADSLDPTKEEQPREHRSNSATKKLASFKPVSITKNFLAKSVAVAAPAPKAGDKGTDDANPAAQRGTKININAVSRPTTGSKCITVSDVCETSFGCKIR